MTSEDLIRRKERQNRRSYKFSALKSRSKFSCILLKMKIIVIINLAFVSVLVVTGAKFEAIDGQNVTISFNIDEVEKADEVRITFKEEKKKYSVLIAQKPWLYDAPQDPGVTLILGKGRVSVIIQNISISRSGLYKAEAYTREKVCEETATLVVNKAPVSSSPSPPHSSSSPKPPRSSDLHWTVIVIVIVISLVIVVSGGVYFWKQRRISCFQRKELGSSSSDCESVAMNGCGENTKDLSLTETGVS